MEAALDAAAYHLEASLTPLRRQKELPVGVVLLDAAGAINKEVQQRLQVGMQLLQRSKLFVSARVASGVVERGSLQVGKQHNFHQQQMGTPTSC